MSLLSISLENDKWKDLRKALIFIYFFLKYVLKNAFIVFGDNFEDHKLFQK